MSGIGFFFVEKVRMLHLTSFLLSSLIDNSYKPISMQEF